MADSCTTDDPTEDDRPSVMAHTCSEDRTVFTEDGNVDAWIATDLTVDLRQ
jgi:hypothetical protein